MQAFVPKTRKPKFDLTIHIIDINNVPLVAGTTYIKWHLPSFTGAEHRGRTEKAYIRDHKAIWDYHKEIPIRLTIDKTQHLQECDIDFEVVQEYFQGHQRDSRVVLGNVKLNLAEYTNHLDAEAESPAGDKDDHEDGMITRRYLMQNSKVNATVKIGLRMRQTEGDTTYISPPLRSAMVIGGIAGIMSAEAGDNEDMPSLTAKTRELSEAQDIYRRTLAATWACQAGEMAPDRLIEDIFAGGDGGRMAAPPAPAEKSLGHGFRFAAHRDSIEDSTSDGESRRTVTQDHLSPNTARTGHRRAQSSDNDYTMAHGNMMNSISGRGSIEQQMQHSRASRKHRTKEAHEVTEYDLRDDLRSWQIQVK